jgi:hypothetical protein
MHCLSLAPSGSWLEASGGRLRAPGACLIGIAVLAGVGVPSAAAQPADRPVPAWRPAADLAERQRVPIVDDADLASPAAAPSQTRPRQRPPARRPAPRPGAEPAVRIQGFGEFGYMGFTASETFNAVLQRSGGLLFGGGARVTHRRGVFAQLGVSRFSGEGERAFVFNNEVFRLGIPLTVTVTPIEVTGGYRFLPRPPRPGAKPARPVPARTGAARRSPRALRPVPYVGGGLGRVLYAETSEFATAQDNVSESFTSYHVLGGVDVPVSRWLGIGAEVKYRWVPDALGTGGLSQAFGETDLGGPALTARVTIGR